MFGNKFSGACQIAPTVLASGLISGLIVLCASSAGAEAQLTCSETARAYASYETSNVDALEFLKACVKDRIGARRDAGAEEKKPQAPLNPVICLSWSWEIGQGVKVYSPG